MVRKLILFFRKVGMVVYGLRDLYLEVGEWFMISVIGIVFYYVYIYI